MLSYANNIIATKTRLTDLASYKSIPVIHWLGHQIDIIFRYPVAAILLYYMWDIGPLAVTRNEPRRRSSKL